LDLSHLAKLSSVECLFTLPRAGGIIGIAIDKDNERAHGRDERSGVEPFYKGNEFFCLSTVKIA
jgi:hypothetical protein